ncbi:thioredoxin family protein [Micromonospora sp. NPDC051296]|uniref:thioredoxin family protein n=1 Tax=Micromonospora sp. NPDC051296 TaxID=3155046 RepID=UPI00342E94C1
MLVTLLSVPGCPHASVLSHRLDEAVAGRTDVTVIHQVVREPDEADRAGMHGSPTILVDGTDPFRRPDEPTSLSCRLYRNLDGGDQGMPTVEELRRALTKNAVCGEGAA